MQIKSLSILDEHYFNFGKSQMNTFSGYGLQAFKHRTKKTSEDIAKILGCSSGIVSLYCHNKSGISLERIEKLFKAGMSLDEVFDQETCTAIRKTEKETETERLLYDLHDMAKVLVNSKELRAPANEWEEISNAFFHLRNAFCKLYQRKAQSDASNNPKG